jgi:hypothetical protein
MNKIFTIDNKYQVISQILQNMKGTLLDVGSRDRILLQYINQEKINYYSADIEANHDYQFTLERTIPFENRHFDYVVCLDVLEHVENIHFAFSELMRISNLGIIVALPNMGTLQRRFWYFLKGNLNTKKYELPSSYPNDRHRWLTVYHEINSFIKTNANLNGFYIKTIYEEVPNFRYFPASCKFLTALNFLRNGLFTERCIYFLQRNN